MGCICVGYYLTWLLYRQDIRQIGSGSAGARNVGRILGKKGFYATLLGDVAKGASAILLAQWIGVENGWLSACILAVLAGHIWPIQLGFRGGKGISVMVGSLMVLDIWLLLVLFGIALLLYFGTRKYMLSGMLAIVLLPLLSYLLSNPVWESLGMAILSLVILISHRDNIASLIAQKNAHPKQAEEGLPDSRGGSGNG